MYMYKCWFWIVSFMHQQSQQYIYLYTCSSKESSLYTPIISTMLMMSTNVVSHMTTHAHLESALGWGGVRARVEDWQRGTLGLPLDGELTGGAGTLEKDRERETLAAS